MLPVGVTGTASALQAVDVQCGKSGGIGVSAAGGVVQKTICCKFYGF